MTMNKRQALLALAALGTACASPLVLAAGEESAPVSADRILKSLDRDIVLDRPPATAGAGTGATASPTPMVAQPGLDLYVQFAFNSADLLPRGRLQLDQLGQALNNRRLLNWGFELAGHTDAVGDADYNMKLSLERANAVKHYLVTNHRLNPNRLVPLGFGYTRPANQANPTAAINRRVEVRRVALANGQAITLGQEQTQSAPGFGLLQRPSANPTATGGRLVPTP
jgi:outer membrane protein OmpA-like peptidoglycan-associated protein